MTHSSVKLHLTLSRLSLHHCFDRVINGYNFTVNSARALDRLRCLCQSLTSLTKCSRYIYIYAWIFENGITNFTPRSGWTPGGVHLRLAVYFLAGRGLSRLVPSNSAGTGLTDHLHLRSPILIQGGRVGLVKTRVFSLISTDFFVIILASQSH